MKILIASSPFTGHINPMFSIARMLVSEGHQVAGLSSSAMRGPIEGAGATFYPFPKVIDRDYRDMVAVFPEYNNIVPGLEMSRFYLERVFIDSIAAQDEGLNRVLSEFSADVILADNLFFGSFPMLLGPPTDRPPIILCGTMFLHFRRDDGAPNFAGLPPAQSEAEREAYAVIAKEHEEMLYLPVRKYLNDCLRRMGIKPLTMDATKRPSCFQTPISSSLSPASSFHVGICLVRYISSARYRSFRSRRRFPRGPTNWTAPARW